MRNPRPAVTALVASFLVSAGIAAMVPREAAGAATDGRELGVRALRLEFARDGEAAPRATLDEQYRAACDAGWKPACDPSAWRPEGRSDLAAAGRRFEEACGQGDAGACTVVGWASDAAGRAGGPDAVPAFKRAARLWKLACDTQGFLPACHEYAGLLYENRGVTADPLAGVLRWTEACDKGEAASCASVAEVYRAGASPVKADPKKAAKYAQRGCALGSPAACAVSDRITPPADPVAANADHCAHGLRATCVALAGEAAPAAGSAALGWLSTACDLGDGASCARVGAASRDAGDGDAARHAWEAGCQAGDAGSCRELGTLALAHPEAIGDWAPQLRAACLLGDQSEACAQLGGAIVDGRVTRDAGSAITLLLRGCKDGGGAPSCAALGRGYETGAVGERDRTLAVRYYGMACDQGDARACESRGDLLVGGVGVRRDDAAAIASYEKACAAGGGTACAKAASVFDEGTQIARDPKKALDLYHRACDARVPTGCYGEGRLLEEGVGGAVDYAGARTAYGIAADAGLTEAKGALSRLLWRGLGGPSQKGKARDLAAQACQEGDPRACGGPPAL